LNRALSRARPEAPFPASLLQVIDTPILVCHIASMGNHRVRRVKTDGTVSYQLGHYEMSGAPGERRSVFKVDVHLGDHPTADEALWAWPREIGRLRHIGRENKANRLQEKLDLLQELTKGEN
jgi:hypothetical protein